MMELNQKKNIPLAPNANRRENVLQLYVAYNLGGTNPISGANITRGYYLYCIPAEMEVTTDPKSGKQTTLYSGTVGIGLKLLLKAVTKQSKKSATEALALAADKEKVLVNATCRTYGFTVAADQK